MFEKELYQALGAEQTSVFPEQETWTQKDYGFWIYCAEQAVSPEELEETIDSLLERFEDDYIGALQSRDDLLQIITSTEKVLPGEKWHVWEVEIFPEVQSIFQDPNKEELKKTYYFYAPY